MNKELLFKTFKNTLGAVAYVFIVSQIMQNGSKFFGQEDTFLTPVAVLLLFSASAAVMAGLVFGPAVLLFMENKKADGVKSAIYSTAWLVIYAFLVLAIMAVLNNLK